ncbi:MAG: DUF427 domain-containing protein [Bacillota bacterium]
MVKVYWENKRIASSDNTIVVEGNHYFPPEDVDQKFLKESDHHTTCPWKGEASYYHLKVDNEINRDAAWYYPNPKEEAEKIKDYIAFYKNKVSIVDDN